MWKRTSLVLFICLLLTKEMFGEENPTSEFSTDFLDYTTGHSPRGNYTSSTVPISSPSPSPNASVSMKTNTMNNLTIFLLIVSLIFM